MKKLILSAAVVCVALASQAATFTWSTRSSGSGVLYDGTENATAYETFGLVDVYLIDVATLTQTAAFNALKAKSFDTSKAIKSTTITSGSKINATTVDYGEEGVNNTLYWVAELDDDTFYISSELTKAPSVSGTTLQWSDTKSTSQSTKDAGSGFDGAGVYAVPEPFSGTLALLGMGVVALRRKMKKAKKA